MQSCERLIIILVCRVHPTPEGVYLCGAWLWKCVIILCTTILLCKGVYVWVCETCVCVCVTCVFVCVACVCVYVTDIPFMRLQNARVGGEH